MKFRIKTAIFLVLLMLLCTSMMALAGDGEGGSKNPFTLDFSQPAHEEKNVQVDSEIQLTFTKNVVNILVLENNMTCFKLLDENGQEVPIEIIMADDQIERDKKRDVILKPKSLLNEDTEYTIIIDSKLESKSGQVLEEDVTLTFSTISTSNNQQLVFMIAAAIVLAIVVIAYIKKRK